MQAFLLQIDESPLHTSFCDYISSDVRHETPIEESSKLAGMKKRISEEGLDFDTLRRMGFEFEAPMDEFSSQAASGGSIGGIVGEQEYGIIEADYSEFSGNENLDNSVLTPANAPEMGVSESSLEESTPVEELYGKKSVKQIHVTDREIIKVSTRRLGRYVFTSPLAVKISVKRGEVILKGRAETSADKLRVEEILRSIPGVRGVTNNIHLEHRH